MRSITVATFLLTVCAVINSFDVSSWPFIQLFNKALGGPAPLCSRAAAIIYVVVFTFPVGPRLSFYLSGC